MARSVKEKLTEMMGGVLAPAPLQALMVLLGPLAQREVSTLNQHELSLCIDRVKLTLRVYCPDKGLAEAVRARVSAALGSGAPQAAEPMPPTPGGPPPSSGEATVAVRSFDDAVQARMLAKDTAVRLGFNEPSSVRIATAVSELARNIVFYAGNGSVSLQPLRPPQFKRVGLRIIASDRGPGIVELENILAGRYKSARGLGLGLKGVRQLMDEFDIKTAPGQGTVVTIAKFL